ncbi:MAG: type II secretion system protein J [Candidatus Methylacidiphilales bacterium]
MKPTPCIKMNPKCLKQGFSLVEIMVSVTVLSIMMVLLFGFFDQSTQAWKSSEKKIDAFREARAALYYLRRDLSSMHVSGDLPFVYYEDPAAVPPSLYSGGPTPPGAHGDLILFLSSQSSEAQGDGKSDLCVVGYYLAYWKSRSSGGSDAANNPSFQLHRHFQNSNETWNNGGRGVFPMLTTAGPKTIEMLFRPASGISNGDEVIARNVTNFSCVPYDADGNIIPTTGGVITQRPNHFRVALTAFNFDTAQKFTRQEDWYYNEATANPLERQNAQTFTLKVAVP